MTSRYDHQIRVIPEDRQELERLRDARVAEVWPSAFIDTREKGHLWSKTKPG